MQDPTPTQGAVGSPGLQPSLDQSSQSNGGGAVGEEIESTLAGAAQAASSLTEQAKQKLTGAVTEQKDAAADLVQHFAKTVHRSGEQFQGHQDWIASAIGRGATELDTLATTLRERDLGELAGQVLLFARRQPALFMGAAFAEVRSGQQ
jgi:ABC-type transporter Mla subunit MlaD